ncbi:hypothetical protein HZH68_013283 [Vespula germanica]|uniref:Uncharacterized protein n=1 Tax=Vespula germanica TaxID=30212 RepID=A0A834JCU9_VESGE|nr:hypothetical protein HZH68_013283 [Vespula germanica]
MCLDLYGKRSVPGRLAATSLVHLRTGGFSSLIPGEQDDRETRSRTGVVPSSLHLTAQSLCRDYEAFTSQALSVELHLRR